MLSKIKIALSVPDSDKPDRYFAFRLRNKLSNEPTEYRHPAKIFVVSDIEGNFQAFRKLLMDNKVINSKYKWLFGDNHLVIIGDCFDRGDQVAECLWLIYSLEEKARRKGGYVHFILGNHEIMNLNGDWRYVHPKYASSAGIPYTALYNGNNELWNWLSTKNIMEKIGDILFVHGGIAADILNLNLSVSEINSLIRPFYSKANLSFSDPALRIIFNSEQSPFWYRGYYKGEVSEELINATLVHFGIKTIITGHTIKEQVTSLFNGKVINVNTDHSNGNSEALLIKNKTFYRIANSGKKEKLK